MQHQIALLNQLYTTWRAQKLPATTQASSEEIRQQVPLELGSEGASETVLQAALQSYLEMNPDVSHKDFNKLLYSGINPTAVLGDWVTALSNATMHTFQMSPVASLMEVEVINAFCRLIGYEHSDGIMVSGGSQANLTGMMLARQKYYPSIREKGMAGNSLVVFCSDQAHYSMQKAVTALGIGTDNLIAVETDSNGCMKIGALQTEIDRAVESNKQPLMINATAGTTVVGAFDDIAALSEVAQKNKLWLHVDGAWGGPVAFSKKHRHLVKGIELADSVGLDAHKVLNVPLTAGVILCRHQNLLAESAGGGGETYLFHADQNSSLNLGAKSIQCGRRADALKIWMSWKERGSNGFEQKIDYLMEQRERFAAIIKEHPSFELLGPTSYLNVLFRYVPEVEMMDEDIDELNRHICRELAVDGTAFIDYASFKGRTGARLIIASEAITVERLLEVLTIYAEMGDSCAKSITVDRFGIT